MRVRLEKCVVVFKNSWRVADDVGNEVRGDSGGGDSADPGDTDPEEHGVEPPQYLRNQEINKINPKPWQ